MGISDAEFGRLLARCQRRRWHVAAWRGFEHWTRAAWPGLFALLLAALVARAPGFSGRLPDVPPRALGWGAAVWLLVAGLAVYKQRARLWLAPWVLPAWLDRNAGAEGALMQRFEASAPGAELTERVLSVRFPKLVPWRLLGGWALLAAAFGAVTTLPPQERPRTLAEQGGSLRVQQTRRNLEALARVDPDASAFVESAQKSLRTLDSKTGGLERADFDALERMDESAARLLQQRTRELDAQRAALDALDSLVASHEAQPGEQARAGALAEQLGRMRQELGERGANTEALDALMEQARALANEADGDKQGQEDEPRRQGGAFDPDAVKQLRDAIGELREVTMQQQSALPQHKGTGTGKDQGPAGMAALDLSHTTAQPWGAHFDGQTFRTQNDDDTVLLTTGTSQRADAPVRDAHGVSTRAFDERSDTALWHKRVLPRHRPVLKAYFGGKDE